MVNQIDNSICRGSSKFMEYQMRDIMGRITPNLSDLNGSLESIDSESRRKLETFLQTQEACLLSQNLRGIYCGRICEYRETCQNPGKGR